MNYCRISVTAGYTLLWYDWFLTIEDEVSLVSSHMNVVTYLPLLL